ncbi:UNVERIFIED_ORG: hypothetical protein M2414_005410 [Rahnella aquatilis]
MKVCYPIRNTNGQEFRQQDEVIRLITGEAHGTWLLGTNGLWHGGIHISDISAPFSAFNPDAVNTGDPVPLQFMTDGTLVAYRVNDTYPSAPYCGRPLRYSSTFALVKSVCKPDPDKEATWLEFYSLYMHLAPVKDYPLSPCYKVNDGHNNITLRQFTRGQYGVPEGDESGAACAAPHPIAKKLKSGDRVVVSRTGRFYVTQHHQSVLMTFGLARLVGGNKPGDEQFWVTLDPELMVPDGELAELMPEWMHLAQEKGTFNEVVVTDGSDCWKVTAGTPLGFLGCMESPGTGAIIAEKEWYAHLEVLSVDTGMQDFLANAHSVTAGKHYVIAQKGQALSIRCGEAGNYTFKEGTAKLGQQVIISRSEANPTQDPSGKWWFNIMGGGWLPQEDISEAGQYDLMKLGFMPLEENIAGDQTDTPFESWVPEVFGQVSRTAEQGHSNQYSLVPQFYRDVLEKMGQDGKISGEEIRRALTIRDPLVRDVVSRMVVKHHSEWFGGRSTGRWDGFYKMLGPLETEYCEKWQADLEWMSKVPPFNQDVSIWHMHPVVFLDAISTPKTKSWAHSPFGKLIGQAESNNNYNAYNGASIHGYRPTYHGELTILTISEVLKKQEGKEIFATGRFQVIHDTLKAAVDSLNLDVNEKYNEEMQDNIFDNYLVKMKRHYIGDYLCGTGSLSSAMYASAQEWASVGIRKGQLKQKIPLLDAAGHKQYDSDHNLITTQHPATFEGESYYNGDGINHASITPKQLEEALLNSKE